MPIAIAAYILTRDTEQEIAIEVGMQYIEKLAEMIKNRKEKFQLSIEKSMKENIAAKLNFSTHQKQIEDNKVFLEETIQQKNDTTINIGEVISDMNSRVDEVNTVISGLRQIQNSIK